MGSKMGSDPELKDRSRRAEGPRLPLGPQPGGGFLLGAGTHTGPVRWREHLHVLAAG